MKNRLYKSFKQLFRLLYRTIGIPILATLACILVMFLFMLGVLAVGQLLYLIIPALPFEAVLLISALFMIMFCIFGINEIVNFYNGYR